MISGWAAWRFTNRCTNPLQSSVYTAQCPCTMCMSSAEISLLRIGQHLLHQADKREGSYSVNSWQMSNTHYSNVPFDSLADWMACLFLLRIPPLHSTHPHLSHCWQIGVPGNSTTPSPALTPPVFLYVISYSKFTHSALAIVAHNASSLNLWTLNHSITLCPTLTQCRCLDSALCLQNEWGPQCVHLPCFWRTPEFACAVCMNRLTEQCITSWSSIVNHVFSAAKAWNAQWHNTWSTSSHHTSDTQIWKSVDQIRCK